MIGIVRVGYRPKYGLDGITLPRFRWRGNRRTSLSTELEFSGHEAVN